jgi:hypothetical protein
VGADFPGCAEGRVWQPSGKIAMMAGCRRWRACTLEA